MHHLLPVSESYLYALCAGDIPFNNYNLDIIGHYICIVQMFLELLFWGGGISKWWN